MWDLEEQRGERGCFKVIIWGGNISNKRGGSFYGEGWFALCNTGFLGTVEDFIGYLFSLYYCCFTCFVSIENGKAKSSIEIVLMFMTLTLNYSVCTVISASTHLFDTNTFTLSLTRIHLLQLKIHNI